MSSRFRDVQISHALTIIGASITLDTASKAAFKVALNFTVGDIAGLSSIVIGKQDADATLAALSGRTLAGTGDVVLSSVTDDLEAALDDKADADAVITLAGVEVPLGGSATAAALKAAFGIVISDVASLQAALDLLAPLASPALTGVPTAPTAADGTNTTQVATTAHVATRVAAAIASLINGAPGALDALNELAAALGNDPDFAATMTNALAGKVPATRTVNGHALSADVTVTKSDVGLGNVEDTALSTWAGSANLVTVGKALVTGQTEDASPSLANDFVLTYDASADALKKVKLQNLGAEVPLTFTTGLTRTIDTITVNTSQNIATLSNLTSNGLVTTSGGTGALGVTVPGTGALAALGSGVTAGAHEASDDGKLVIFSTGGTLNCSHQITIADDTTAGNPATIELLANPRSNGSSYITCGAISTDREIFTPNADGVIALVNGELGTPSSITLTNGTGLPISTGISGLGTGVATALAASPNAPGGIVTFSGDIGAATGSTLTLGADGVYGLLALSNSATPHYNLTISNGSLSQTANRSLSFDIGNTSRTLTLTGSPTISSITITGNGSLSVGSSAVTFGSAFATSGNTFTTNSVTYTLPGATATLARLGANTFTDDQTITTGKSLLANTITVASGTTATLYNTTATTVNAFGAASVALNLGNASGTNTILGTTVLTTLAGTGLQFKDAGTNICYFSAGHLLWNTNNTYDIGAFGPANCPRHIYVAGSVSVGGGGAFNFGSVGFASRNAGTGAVTISTNAGNLILTPGSGTTAISGAATIGTTLTVTGASTLSGALIATPQALSDAGAVNVTTTTTVLTVTSVGSKALTLADGTNGQIKTICLVSVSGGGTALLTPTTATGFSTVTFSAASDIVTLQFFTATGWVKLASSGALVA